MRVPQVFYVVARLLGAAREMAPREDESSGEEDDDDEEDQEEDDGAVDDEAGGAKAKAAPALPPAAVFDRRTVADAVALAGKVGAPPPCLLPPSPCPAIACH